MISRTVNALEERTRKRVPLDWAMIQNNRGNVLAVLRKSVSDSFAQRFSYCALLY